MNTDIYEKDDRTVDQVARSLFDININSVPHLSFTGIDKDFLVRNLTTDVEINDKVFLCPVTQFIGHTLTIGQASKVVVHKGLILVDDGFQVTERIHYSDNSVVYKVIRNGRIMILKIPLQDREQTDRIQLNNELVVPGTTNSDKIIILRHVLHYDYGERQYEMYVLDYCQGGSLNRLGVNKGDWLLDECKQYSYLFAVEVVKQVLEGLKALWKRNYIHRDIKLENVGVCDLQSVDDGVVVDGTIKIIDFGTAIQKNATPSSSGPKNNQTDGYVCPNENEMASEKSDIYALGVVLLKMVTQSKTAPPNKTNKKEYEKELEIILEGHPFRRLLFGMLRFESDERFGEKEILDVLEKMESNNDTDEYWGFWKHIANQMPTFVFHVFLETLSESEMQLLAKMNNISKTENIVLEVMARHVIESGEDDILTTIWESGSEQDRVESFIWQTVCNNNTCLLIPKTRRILFVTASFHLAKKIRKKFLLRFISCGPQWQGNFLRSKTTGNKQDSHFWLISNLLSPTICTDDTEALLVGNKDGC